MSLDAESYFDKAREHHESGNPKAAIRVLKEASNRGHELATQYLADDYFLGRDVRKSKRKSLVYTKHLAGLGNLDAALTLVHHYKRLTWIPGREQTQLKYFKIIADAEPCEKHFDLIMSTAKLMVTLLRDDEYEAERYREKYERMKCVKSATRPTTHEQQ